MPGPTAFTTTPIMEQLCDEILSKLIQHLDGQLPSKQWVVGSNPARDATASREVYAARG